MGIDQRDEVGDIAATDGVSYGREPGGSLNTATLLWRPGLLGLGELLF